MRGWVSLRRRGGHSRHTWWVSHSWGLPCCHLAYLTSLVQGEEGGGGGEFVIGVSFGMLGGCSTTES
jgi:hypothetical protein